MNKTESGPNQKMVCHKHIVLNTVNPVKNGHTQKDRKLVFKTSYSLMQVKSIAECSKGSILQYF